MFFLIMFKNKNLIDINIPYINMPVNHSAKIQSKWKVNFEAPCLQHMEMFTHLKRRLNYPDAHTPATHPPISLGKETHHSSLVTKDKATFQVFQTWLWMLELILVCTFKGS